MFCVGKVSSRVFLDSYDEERHVTKSGIDVHLFLVKTAYIFIGHFVVITHTLYIVFLLLSRIDFVD